MKIVYLLEHVYELHGEEEVKFIGVFSSREFADNALKNLNKKPGFSRLPIECFQIYEIKLNEYSWKEGFFTYGEGYEC
jgi:hypothetical protein